MTDTGALRIDGERLMRPPDALAEIGAIDGDGVLPPGAERRGPAGRDRVVGWMRELASPCASTPSATSSDCRAARGRQRR